MVGVSGAVCRVLCMARHWGPGPHPPPGTPPPPRLAELEGKVKVAQSTDMEEFARRYGLDMLVKPEQTKLDQDELIHGRTRATVRRA